MNSQTSSTMINDDEINYGSIFDAKLSNVGVSQRSRRIAKTRVRKSRKSQQEDHFKSIEFGFRDINTDDENQEKLTRENSCFEENLNVYFQEGKQHFPGILYGDISIGSILNLGSDELENHHGEMIQTHLNHDSKKLFFCLNKRVHRVILHKHPLTKEEQQQQQQQQQHLMNNFNTQDQQIQQQQQINSDTFIIDSQKFEKQVTKNQHLGGFASLWDNQMNLQYNENSFNFEEEQFYFDDHHPSNNQNNKNLILDENFFLEEPLNGNCKLQTPEVSENNHPHPSQELPKSPQNQGIPQSFSHNIFQQQQQFQGIKLISIQLESLTQPDISTFDIERKTLLKMADKLKVENVTELTKELEEGKLRSSSLQYHFKQVKSILNRENCLEEVMEQRQMYFDKVSNDILLSESYLNEMQQQQQQQQSQQSAIFYVKTQCNYYTESVCNTEIGLSKDFLSILKMPKHIQEFIGSIKNCEIPNIFSANTSKKLSLFLLAELGTSNQHSSNPVSFLDTIQSFDHIDVPATITIQSIPIVFSQEQFCEIPLMNDRLLIVQVAISDRIRNEMNILRCKMQKRQSFKYRTLFPTMSKRKYSIDKLIKHTQNERIKSKSYFNANYFYERYYPEQLQHIQEELETIRKQLIRHSTHKKHLSHLIQAIVTSKP